MYQGQSIQAIRVINKNTLSGMNETNVSVDSNWPSFVHILAQILTSEIYLITLSLHQLVITMFLPGVIRA